MPYKQIGNIKNSITMRLIYASFKLKIENSQIAFVKI